MWGQRLRRWPHIEQTLLQLARAREDHPLVKQTCINCGSCWRQVKEEPIIPSCHCGRHAYY